MFPVDLYSRFDTIKSTSDVVKLIYITAHGIYDSLYFPTASTFDIRVFSTFPVWNAVNFLILDWICMCLFITDFELPVFIEFSRLLLSMLPVHISAHFILGSLCFIHSCIIFFIYSWFLSYTLSNLSHFLCHCFESLKESPLLFHLFL